MLHTKYKNCNFDAVLVLVFHTVVFFTLICSCRAQPQVTAPSQPIVAAVGDKVILPCHLQPAEDASDMSVEWTRPDLDPRYVHVLHDREELLSLKHPSYRERTSLFIDELKNGNISLKLSKVKPADEGKYRCFIPEISRDSTVQLVVGAVSSPVISLAGIDGDKGEVVLQCESKGCYPEPELLWLDAEGKIFSAGPTETVRGPDDLYTVSSRVTVEKRHSNNITCRVQQRNINQTRETQIHVPDDFFMVLSSPKSNNNSNMIIVWIVTAAVFLLFIPAVVFVVWKWRKNKFKNRRMSHEDGEEEKFNSKCDKTELCVVVEGEEESRPLMAERVEEDNLDSREKNIESQRGKKDSQFVTERETNQDQLKTNSELRDMDRTEGEKKHRSVKTEKEPLILTEQETQKEQNIMSKKGGNGSDKTEGAEEKRQKDEGLLAVGGQQQSQMSVSREETNLDERERKKKNNSQTDQKVKKPEKERTKKKSEQDKDKKLDQKKQQENQTEHMQPETERQKVEDDKKFLHEMKERREREKEEKKLYLKDRKQKERTTGPDDKREKDCEENQRDFTVMNQNQENNERLKQTEEEKKFHLDRRGVEEQKHRPENKTQNRDQHVLEIKKQDESKTERNQDKREKDQKMKEKNHQSEIEKKFPSVNRDDTERTEVKIQQINQELQKQPEEKVQRRLEEVRLQEDGFGKVESQEGAKGNMMKTNKTQRKIKKVKERQPRQEGLMETEQEPEKQPLGGQIKTTEQEPDTKPLGGQIKTTEQEPETKPLGGPIKTTEQEPETKPLGGPIKTTEQEPETKPLGGPIKTTEQEPETKPLGGQIKTTEQEPETKPLGGQEEMIEQPWKNPKGRVKRVKFQKDQQEMSEIDEGQRDMKRRRKDQDLELDVFQQQSDGMNHIYKKPEQQDEDLMEFESEANMETD
uniref:Ig-like domain-containing protein n=1 Tax=Anabas testudineus TaxID=64144 RepID=A0AAQ6IDW3_ANATE